MPEMELKTTTRVLGDFSAQVSGPRDLPEPEVTLTFRPESVAEFELIMEALGGIEWVRFPDRSTYYDDPAWVRREDPKVRAMIFPPPREKVVDEQPVHPFFGSYAAAQARLVQS